MKTIHLGDAWTYALQTPIAQTACGCVWQALHVQTCATVAVKTNMGHANQQPPAAQQVHAHWLAHEIAIAKTMAHRHVVTYLHDGVANDFVFCVMEHMHGALSAIAQHHVSVSAALDIFVQVLAGLDYLHQLGYRHLDIKPDNILFRTTPNGYFVRLADFGTMVQQAEHPADYQHNFVGTLGWLAPEQVLPAGWDADNAAALYCTSQATDMYALGLLLFYLMTGGQRTVFSQRVQDGMQQGADALSQLAQQIQGFGLTPADKQVLQQATGLSGSAYANLLELIEALLLQRCCPEALLQQCMAACK